MKARFIGDPNDNFSGPQHMRMWGVDFVKGEWVQVTDPRFATNNHFEFDDGIAPLVDPEDGYEGMKVPALKALAAARGVDALRGRLRSATEDEPQPAPPVDMQRLGADLHLGREHRAG